MFSFSVEKDEELLYKSKLFKGHAGAVIGTVDAAVGLLEKNDMDTLVAVLKDLGGKHVEYGIVEAHYPVVGQALLDTLEKALGDAFTPEVKEAWAGVYGVIQEKMLEGASEVEQKKKDAAAASKSRMVHMSFAVFAACFSYVAVKFMKGRK